MDRILGKIEGEMPGPLIICLAGVHGNEQVGIHAFRNVYSAIRDHKIKFRGKLLGIVGNIKAIHENKRYIDVDLNRVWSGDYITDLLTGERVPTYSEDFELLDIYRTIERESSGSYSLRVIADLHSTSSDQGNFVVVPEEVSNHAVIKALKLPVVVDIDKYLKGTLLSFYNNEGYISFAFEGGMIGTESVYQLHTSGLWEILDKAGCITHHDHEAEDHYANHLHGISRTLPEKVKVLHREPIQPGDGFRMLPGFHNFMPVKKGQVLAVNHSGKIHAPVNGLIFMPLYQSEGSDGFFVVKPIGENDHVDALTLKS